MFDRFTDTARKAMAMSREQALRFHHDHIGTEHILLGLLQAGGVAGKILEDCGVERDALRREVEKTMRDGGAAPKGQMPFTPRAKKVLELAMEEAKLLGHNYMGTEHVLLGLVCEKEGIAARALTNAGLELEAVRAKAAEILATDLESVSPAPAQPSKLRLKEPPPDPLAKIFAELQAIRSDLDEIKKMLREGGKADD